MELTKFWNGFVQGTNVGKFNLEFTEQGETLKAVLRFMDDATGPVVYDLNGQISDEGIILTGLAIKKQEGVEYGDLKIICSLTPEGNLQGQWETSLHTGGTFTAFPFTGGGRGTKSEGPEQIFTKRVELGFIQLYKDDIQKLAEFIRSDFPGARLIITYQCGPDPERVCYFEEFINRSDINNINFLRFNISQPEVNGINRNINLEFRSAGSSFLSVQGATEPWVRGRVQMIANYLERHEDKIRNMAIQFSPSFQILIVIGMVIWMTNLSSSVEKILLGAGAFVGLKVAPWGFLKLFPNAVIRFGDEKPGYIIQLLRKGGSWVFALVASVTVLLFEHFADKLVASIEAFFSTFLS